MPGTPGAPGWHPDPITAGEYERWWDGNEWHDSTRPPGGPKATAAAALLLSTTPTIEGRDATRYLGLVFGDAIVGIGLLDDLAASVRDVTGGRSTAYEDQLSRARELALGELQDQAYGRGADAVVGVTVGHEPLRGSMLIVTAQGTAVKLAAAGAPMPAASAEASR